MTKQRHILRTLFGMLGALALFATACGGGGGPSNEEVNAAQTAAADNEAQLVLTDDLASTELLNTADGSVTTLADVVTGDRPVLLWYWAPH